jgi:hypothetical protein
MKQAQSISFEEALKDPAYEHLWESIRFLESARFEDLFPEKHLLALQDILSVKIKALYQVNPLLPLKDVVKNALSDLADDTSAQTVLAMTKYAIEQWESLSTKGASVAA